MDSPTKSLSLQNIEQVSAAGVERCSMRVLLHNIRSDFEIDCTAYRMYPALWNAHDHLEFNLFPRIGTGPYNNAYEWGLEITQSKRDPVIDKVLGVSERTRYFFGALKNILSATPFVLHHGDTPEFILDETFPITVIPQHSSPHSLRFEKSLAKKFSEGNIRSIHLAEGTDLEAHSELQKLHELGFLDERTGVVHGVGLTEQDIQLIKQHDANFIWCPSSNNFLFSKQAPLRGLLEHRIPIMLGSDSTLTGTDGMLSEIRFANTILRQPSVLFEATTQSLAQWLSPFMNHIPESFFIAPKSTSDAMADFASLQRSDVLMLVHDDQILLTDPEVIDILDGPRAVLGVDGSTKHVAGEWDGMLEEVIRLLGPHSMHGVSVT